MEDVSEAVAAVEHFEFAPSSAPAAERFAALKDKENVDLLTKWGISPSTSFELMSLRFDQVFRRGNANTFLLDMFNSSAFKSQFRLGDGRGAGFVAYPAVEAKSVAYKPLTVTATTMDLLDKVMNDEIVVSSSGHIRKMMDVYLPCGVTVADRLRGLYMLGDESEDAGLYTPREKDELLYHVMWRILSGGALNQWEDTYDVYRSFTKELYKDLVSVVANPATGELEAASVAYIVESINQGEVPLFPRDDERGNCNYLYVTIHPIAREVVIWYNAFWSPF